ncbi:unnamed protein product, partial [Ectocarpus fasciculatus]
GPAGGVRGEHLARQGGGRENRPRQRGRAVRGLRRGPCPGRFAAVLQGSRGGARPVGPGRSRHDRRRQLRPAETPCRRGGGGPAARPRGPGAVPEGDGHRGQAHRLGRAASRNRGAGRRDARRLRAVGRPRADGRALQGVGHLGRAPRNASPGFHVRGRSRPSQIV